MRSPQEWFGLYAESHQNPTNKLIHWICVPTIFFSLLGLLWSIPFPPLGLPLQVNWGTIILALALVFYFRLSHRLANGMLFVSIVFMLLLTWLQNAGVVIWAFSLGLFVAAWIGQFIGHKIEGKKPSFLHDVQFLLIGPIWLLGFVYQRLGIAY